MLPERNPGGNARGSRTETASSTARPSATAHTGQARKRLRHETQSGPPDYDCGDIDGGCVICCELIVAGGDASPVFETAEHAFDEISEFVGLCVERMLLLSGGIVGNDGYRSAPGQELSETIAVIGRIGGAKASFWAGAQDSQRGTDIAELPRCYFDGDRSPATICCSMDFRCASAPRAANRLRLGPPFPPAAER